MSIFPEDRLLNYTCLIFILSIKAKKAALSLFVKVCANELPTIVDIMSVIIKNVVINNLSKYIFLLGTNLYFRIMVLSAELIAILFIQYYYFIFIYLYKKRIYLLNYKAPKNLVIINLLSRYIEDNDRKTSQYNIRRISKISNNFSYHYTVFDPIDI